jgi:glyoxylase-like metal-dependent hydrolase (beta-lactamase superfamily II)
VEWEHCKTLLARDPAHVPHIADSIQPIFDAGLADLVETNHHVTGELWLEPTPGHTPGHVSVHIASVGHDGIITGDTFHSPIQCAEPDLRTNFCFDHETSRRTRRDFLSRYENKQAFVFFSHFPDPTAGWIIREERNWRFSAD